MSDEITPDHLRFERLLDADADTVWRFLTDPALRARWFMGGPIEPRAGGTIGFTMAHDRLSDEPTQTPARYAAAVGQRWSERITRYEPPHVLAFEWDGGEGGEVKFELTPEGARTRLVLVHTGLRGRDDALNFGGGWCSHLAVLEARLRGDGVRDFWALHADSEAAMARMLDVA